MPTPKTYAGVARTVKSYPLVVDTEMYVPYLLQLSNHSGAKQIFGELYFVDDNGLKFLDEFEGLESGFYIRESIDLVVQVPGEEDCKLTADVKLESGSLQVAGAYFRSPTNLGPLWAHAWTVDRLQSLPMVERFTLEHATAYIDRGERKIVESS